MLKTLKRLLVILPLALFVLGCAPQKLPDVFYPSPPDKPRIKYIKSYRSASDLKAGSMAAAIILGQATTYDLRKPSSVEVDGAGRIYISDTAYADVFIFDPPNKKATSIANMGTKIFYKPVGVRVDSKGRIFVSDTRLDKVAVISPEGNLLQYLEPKMPFKQPTGLAIDEAHDRLYVVDTHLHNVQAFSLKTLKHVMTIGSRGSEEASFNYPSNVAVDKKGNIYVVDTMNARVQIFDKDGRFIRSFGRFGDVAGEFARPKGIALDSEGHIYVADAAFNNVQIFNQEGQILMAFGGYGNGRGQMILPNGIAIDKDDYIYVVDSWNERVNVYEFLGEKHKAREAQKGK
ncbi:MAG: 6-bladed beta-propeller [Thermodesulfobacteriota bacterium]|nr:MAG: 6-bladed beta-propeller [Thermodesulfobacteriota bacterium]